MNGLIAFVVFKALEAPVKAAKAAMAVGRHTIEPFTVVVRCAGGIVRKSAAGTATNTAALLSKESIALALAKNGILREHLLRTLVEVTNARLTLAEPCEETAKQIGAFMPLVEHAAEQIVAQVRQGNTGIVDCDCEFELLGATAEVTA